MVENGCFDLSNPQKSIWNMGNFFEGTCICNVCTMGLIHEEINTTLLIEAINNVVKKNDSFRLIFSLKDGKPIQEVKKYEPFDIPVIEVKNKLELNKIKKEAVSQEFNTIGGFLFDFKIVILPNKNAAIILTVNHLIADSWSLGLVIQAILKEYHALVNKIVLEDELHSYIDYLLSEEEYKKSKKYKNDYEYWNKVFEDIPEDATIPSNKKVQKTISSKAKRESFILNTDTVKNIKTLCANNKYQCLISYCLFIQFILAEFLIKMIL